MIDEHVEPAIPTFGPLKSKELNLLINDESDEDSEGNNIQIEDENISESPACSFKPGCDSKNARNNFAKK